ncbi:GntR family transcriptional regulator [Microlunatus endophyticus]|uniref:GntR family transcriptional regulator n=1 Tax=Microlunatus endophyticus TaxID=1716077 RepID=A0A917W778_9ACTN|nr:PLP-dependent aminotransferase family protein [Microlunatus endophyticus]GGL77788.1 GntR family transcriptional regulator [Microlunatus endophyticus]
MTQLTAAGLTLELGPDGPLTQRLATALRDAVRAGSLAPGAALPPSRLLAAELGCSRWVVTEAYGQLVAEGYLQATTGSATTVRDLGGVAPLGPLGPPPSRPRPRYDLTPGFGDVSMFPRTRWLEAYRRAVMDRPTAMLADRSPVGTLSARTVLTDYLLRARQVREDPTQVVITTGAGASVGWISRVLHTLSHRRIGVEDPSWSGLRDTAERAGLEMVPIGVDDQGLRVRELDDHPDVRVVLCTPTHQFPLGVALSPDRRLELIKWADRVDGVIIEDDYDAEFRYDRRPVGSLQGMAPDRVVLVGSVSQSLGPMINVGWAILPQWLIMRILADGLDAGTGPSVFGFEALSIMIAEGWYERHLRALRTSYRRRRENLVSAITAMLPDCTISGMAAGTQLIMELPQGVDVAAVVRRAAGNDVGVAPLDRYRLAADLPSALVIGYGNLREDRENEAIGRLAAAIRGA